MGKKEQEKKNRQKTPSKNTEKPPVEASLLLPQLGALQKLPQLQKYSSPLSDTGVSINAHLCQFIWTAPSHSTHCSERSLKSSLLGISSLQIAFPQAEGAPSSNTRVLLCWTLWDSGSPSLAVQTSTATHRREVRPAAVTYNFNHLQPQPVKLW